jgi:hypothetical protein
MYAIIATAEFFGPRTETRVLGFARDIRTARAKVEDMAADATRGYGCQMLEHNQASGWDFAPRRVKPRAHYYRGVFVPPAGRVNDRGFVGIHDCAA